MSTLSDSPAFPRAVYRYQLVFDLGMGSTFSSGTMMTILADSTDNVGGSLSFRCKSELVNTGERVQPQHRVF